MKSTGCIGFASENSGLFVRCAIESFTVIPRNLVASIWVDVFAENKSNKPSFIGIIHRGSLAAENVTQSAWRQQSSCEVQKRVVALHSTLDPIVVGDDSVLLSGNEYGLFSGKSGDWPALVGGHMEADEPFTLWNVGPFPPGERVVVRLRLQLSRKSFLKQIGADATEFYSFGDAILLDRIDEDILAYNEPGKESFQRALKEFKSGRTVAEVFEYLLVSLGKDDVRWDATPLTYNFSRQIVPEPYTNDTHWFIARYPRLTNESVQPENAFVLKAVEQPVCVGVE